MSKKLLVNLYNKNKNYILKILLINVILSIIILFFFKTYNQNFSKTEIQLKYKINLIKNYNQILSEFYAKDFNAILEQTIIEIKKKISYDFKNLTVNFQSNGSIELDFKHITDNKNKDFHQNFKNIIQKDISEIKSMYQEKIDKNLYKFYNDNKNILLTLNQENQKINNDFIKKKKFEDMSEIIDLYKFIYEDNSIKSSLLNSFVNAKYDVLFSENYQIISLFESLIDEKQINKSIKLSDQFFILILIYLCSITIIIYRMFDKK